MKPTKIDERAANRYFKQTNGKTFQEDFINGRISERKRVLRVLKNVRTLMPPYSASLDFVVRKIKGVK
jgi:hypothetical protein